jgi:tol-pal system protein YbgF
MKKNLFKFYGFWFLVLGAFIALNAFSEPVVESRSAISSSSSSSSGDYPFTTGAPAGDSDVVETTTTSNNRPSVIPNSDGASSSGSSTSGNNTAINTGSGDPVQSVNTFNAMQQDIQELRGSIEELQYKLQQLEQQQKDRYINIDQRLRALEGGGAAVSAIPVDATSTSGGGATNDGRSTTSAAPSGNEKADYDAAFNLMTKDKNFDKATKAFSDFVEQYPMGFYTPNAWYWLGKLYSFDTKNLSKSRDAFQKVVQEFPTNTKASDALYELGVTYDKLGDKDQAKKTLKSVPTQYPGTGAAIKAQQYLKEKSL